MGGLIRTSEAIEHGIHRRTLYGLRDNGTLLQITRGLFQLADLDTPAEVNLAEVAKKSFKWRHMSDFRLVLPRTHHPNSAIYLASPGAKIAKAQS